jgi:hypothetical protein
MVIRQLLRLYSLQWSAMKKKAGTVWSEEPVIILRTFSTILRKHIKHTGEHYPSFYSGSLGNPIYCVPVSKFPNYTRPWIGAYDVTNGKTNYSRRKQEKSVMNTGYVSEKHKLTCQRNLQRNNITARQLQRCGWRYPNTHNYLTRDAKYIRIT